MAWWETPPVFSSGQVLSASAHLNALARCAQVLFDRFTGYGMPFVGGSVREGQTLSYRIRHKWDTFDWKFYVKGDVSISINGNTLAGTVKSTGSWTWFSGSEDISALGLTENEFYTVAFTCTDADLGAIGAYLYLMRETVSPTFPTLAAFTDGTTPTADEWQDLSDYATALHTALDGAATAASNAGQTLRGDKIWIGTLSRRAAYLYVSLKLRTPQYKDDGGKACRAKIYLDDVLAETLTVEILPGEPNYTNGTKTETKTAIIDLDGESIALGADYRVRIDQSHDGDGANDFAEVLHIYEAPESTPILPSWVTPYDWDHGDYVKGDGSPKPILDLAFDLEVLQALMTACNYPASGNREATTPFGTDRVSYMHARRVRRWLHYRNEEDGEPKLVYTFGEEKTLSLADAADDWLAYDLDSLEGLFAGTYYQLQGVSFAFEDDEP